MILEFRRGPEQRGLRLRPPLRLRLRRELNHHWDVPKNIIKFLFARLKYFALSSGLDELLQLLGCTSKYPPFHKTLQSSSVSVNWLPVRFYEMDCIKTQILNMSAKGLEADMFVMNSSFIINELP